jgi:hypothetical protein
MNAPSFPHTIPPRSKALAGYGTLSALCRRLMSLSNEETYL